MLVFLITDENFNQQQSCCETTKMGIVTKLHKAKQSITIATNAMAPFAIYKWEEAGHFAISNRLEPIAEYIATLGFELTYAHVESKYAHVKPYVDQARDCSNVKKITQWNTVVIDGKGVIRVTKKSKQPFLIPLTSRRGVKLLLAWLEKYLILARREIENHNFIPTLTGGLDTRTLTWFWRDLYSYPDYYLKAVKPDGKNSVNKGYAEIEIATQILNRLGKSLARKEKYNRPTFSGLFTENGRGWKKSLNNSNFIYDYIAYHFNYEDLYFGQNFICPFVDNLYLQLKHPEVHYMRTLLALLLCPDLLDIQLYGFSNEPPYQFNTEFADLIPRVEQFIQKYKLRKRVAKVKAKVLSSK